MINQPQIPEAPKVDIQSKVQSKPQALTLTRDRVSFREDLVSPLEHPQQNDGQPLTAEPKELGGIKQSLSSPTNKTEVSECKNDSADSRIPSAQKQKQKQRKSKKIKKVLKERLNIDCLRMLGEESDESPSNAQIKQNQKLMDQGTKDEPSDGDLVLEDFTEVYSVRDLLGVGAFGVVLLVINKITKEKSALKIINKEKLSERAFQILRNESKIMQSMGHHSVVSFKRIFENQKYVILEMEYIPGGQLKKLFKTRQSDLEASKVIKSLLEGVAYIHDRSIVHRDLKPENVLLCRNTSDCREVKIVDFGLSAIQNMVKGEGTKEKAGTLIYMAPEQIINKEYSKKVDLWPCGVMMYQLLSGGQHPVYNKGETQDVYLKKISKIEQEPLEWNFPRSFSDLAKDFFQKLCTFPANNRYDAATALMHPWITRNTQAETPLTKKQELLRFDLEHDLRKVMRMVYFTANIQISQTGEGDDIFFTRNFAAYKKLIQQVSSGSFESTSAESKRKSEQEKEQDNDEDANVDEEDIRLNTQVSSPSKVVRNKKSIRKKRNLNSEKSSKEHAIIYSKQGSGNNLKAIGKINSFTGSQESSFHSPPKRDRNVAPDNFSSQVEHYQQFSGHVPPNLSNYKQVAPIQDAFDRPGRHIVPASATVSDWFIEPKGLIESSNISAFEMHNRNLDQTKLKSNKYQSPEVKYPIERSDLQSQTPVPKTSHAQDFYNLAQFNEPETNSASPHDKKLARKKRGSQMSPRHSQLNNLIPNNLKHIVMAVKGQSTPRSKKKPFNLRISSTTIQNSGQKQDYSQGQHIQYRGSPIKEVKEEHDTSPFQPKRETQFCSSAKTTQMFFNKPQIEQDTKNYLSESKPKDPFLYQRHNTIPLSSEVSEKQLVQTTSKTLSVKPLSQGATLTQASTEGQNRANSYLSYKAAKKRPSWQQIQKKGQPSNNVSTDIAGTFYYQQQAQVPIKRPINQQKRIDRTTSQHQISMSAGKKTTDGKNSQLAHVQQTPAARSVRPPGATAKIEPAVSSSLTNEIQRSLRFQTQKGTSVVFDAKNLVSQAVKGADMGEGLGVQGVQFKLKQPSYYAFQ